MSAPLDNLEQIKAIDKWDGRLPSVTGGAMPFIDAQKYVN